MKNFLKRISTLLLALTFFALPVSAAGSATQGEIPSQMQPGTILEYVDSTAYIIRQGGPCLQKSAPRLSEEQLSLLDVAKENGSYDAAYHEELPKPVKGVVVTYSSDGYIDDITFPAGVQNPLLVHKALPSPVEPADQVRPRNDIDGLYLIATWGAHGNALYRIWNTSGRMGYGRATTFNDSIGQADIKNRKGSVATKLKYDDCKVWTTINVRAKQKNGNGLLFVDMQKTDAGGLPDAVIDIWKTGVEFWGYTYSSTFSMPEDVSYYHG